MDHSLWTGEQAASAQPETERNKFLPVFLALYCRGRWGLCSSWEHLCTSCFSKCPSGCYRD